MGLRGIFETKSNKATYTTIYEFYDGNRHCKVSTIAGSIANPNIVHCSIIFKDTYCTHVEQWATCYRVGTPMNTNMFSESFHRVLYLQHKHNRGGDFLLYTLLKIARDKAFDQLQKWKTHT